VSKVVALIPIAIDLMKEFASGFSSGFSEVLAGLGEIGGIAGDQKQVWFDFGRVVAKGFGLALTVVNLFAKAIAFLDTPAGRVVATLGGLVLIFPKLVAVAGGIASTWGALVGMSEVIIGGIAAVLPVIGTVLGTIAGAIGSVLAAIGAVLGLPAIAVAAIVAAVVAAGIAIYTYWDEIMAFFGNAEAWLEDAGGRLIEGLVNGLLAGWERLKGAVVGIAEGIVGTVKSVLRIQSPSRVMEQLGAYTAEGFARGIEGGGGLSPDAGSGLAEAGSAPFRAQALGGSRSVVQHNRFTVTVTVGAGAKAREVRSAVAEGIRQALDKSGEFAGA
jgi:phage-related minor tail protein